LIKAKVITHYGLFFWWTVEKNDYRVLYIDTNKDVSLDSNITQYLSHIEGSNVAPRYCCTFQRVFKVGETAIVNIYEYYPPVEKDNYHSVIATLKVKIK
jgi:hypothetical protein